MVTLCELREDSLRRMNRRRAFWAAAHIQRFGGQYLPWLCDAIYAHLDPPEAHIGPVLPEFYHMGVPSAQWVCACCRHEVP